MIVPITLYSFIYAHICVFVYPYVYMCVLGCFFLSHYRNTIIYLTRFFKLPFFFLTISNSFCFSFQTPNTFPVFFLFFCCFTLRKTKEATKTTKKRVPNTQKKTRKFAQFATINTRTPKDSTKLNAKGVKKYTYKI